MTSATEELRRLLDERGVEWWYGISEKSTVFDGEHGVRYEVDGTLGLLFIRSALSVTTKQAIAATLGDSVATGERQSVERVYLVEVSNELIEGWCPLGVYLHKESAENCAETYRREEDGVRQFARVIELKVEDA